MRALLIVCAVVCAFSPVAVAASAAGRNDLHRLLSCLPPGNREQEEFFEYSRRFAPTTGAWIIDAIIPDLRQERDDGKFIIYLSLVLYLKRAPAEHAARKWLHSRHHADRIWAQEFLTELAADSKARLAVGAKLP